MFKEFELKDIFETQPFRGGLQVPTGALMKSDELEKGTTPRITVTSDNNGIGGYYKDVDNKNYRTFENCISVSFLGTVFYHPYKASFDMKVHCLKPLKHELVETEALYIIPALRKKLAGNDYFTQTTSTDLPYMTILFPVIENSNPDHEYTVDDIDWQYMRERIAELERERIAELDAYLQATGLNDYELTMDEEMALRGFFDESVSIKKFKIGELFSSESGDTDIQKSDINGEGLQVVSSGVGNRGVVGTSDIKAKVIDVPSITVDMFGNVFYREEPYKMVTHARIFALVPLQFSLDTQLGEYFEAQIKKTCVGYDYNNMCSFSKISDKEIEVPINTDGSINFAYIYIYIRAVEKETIKEVVRYKEKLMSIYRSVV